ncbi:CRISPR-associated endonuclease Cas3'' [Desulfobulbus alkaliphilus]|uniref:CRISPR-associated endonuclease Cas3'' n=1 Tax=Desulfobulbus alkaliphilus TaxID=869814 RepID=UPI0019654DD0|nr:CRISPR-associated endonuclease Cas3'' [Desulfobulbus alkaliphilus]MBM9537322.1 CRISPR-associated endonuclease Cas3'' [Desulfobulbus alkaliphilus]
MKNYAHSTKKTDQSDWQQLSVHLLVVATLAREFARGFGLNDPAIEDEALLAGLLHDLGKYRSAFQEYLRGERAGDAETRHAIYGGAHAFTSEQLGAAFAIAGHHAGLHDLADLQDGTAKAAEKEDLATLAGLLEKEYSTARAFLTANAAPLEKTLPEILPPFPGMPVHLAKLANEADEKSVLATELYTRMLFSCLVDADRLDSAYWAKSDINIVKFAQSESPLDADYLLSLVIAERDRKRAAALNPESALTDAQNRIFDACLGTGTYPPGFFSLTVPTGGGKTLSAMAFALAHAKANRLRRVIVVIPYLSIIEQNAAEYRHILDSKNRGIILENHSSVIPRVNSNEEANSRLELITENWDAPIIITTSVQFIESLFAASPSRVRKLHNIARSVVIFDEVQTLPTHLLRPMLNVFRELTANYGVSFVFSSATQPAFRRTRSLPDGFDEHEITEIAPEPAELYRTLRRVTYKLETGTEPLGWEALAGQLAATPQCLCVVNLTRHARELWETLDNTLREEYRTSGGEDLPGNLRPVHLSSAMCPAHRLALIRWIRMRLGSGLSCRVVSTQLIEAGVDVDFPAVWRAMGPLDSIVQVAGRCNRKGRFPPTESCVRVFTPADAKKLPPGIYSTATQQAAVTLARLGKDAAEKLATSPDIFQDYFTELYAITSTDYDKRGEASIQEERANMHFRKVAAKAKIIEDSGQPVVIPIGKARHLIDKIRTRKAGRGEPRFTRDDLRRLQRYMVNVRTNNFDRLLKVTQIEPLLPYLDLYVLKEGAYHANLGLLVNDRPLEDFFV